MKHKLADNEQYLLNFGNSEIDLTDAIFGITENGSSASVENGVVNLGNVVKCNSTGTSIWVGAKAQYDAIATKDPNTLYFITGSTE